MKNKAVTFLILCALLSPLHAAKSWNTSLVGYYIPSDFSLDTKTDTAVTGVYGYFGYKRHALELEYDSVKSLEDSVDVQQHSLAIYSYLLPSSAKVRVGYQNISAETGGKSVGLVIAGISRNSYSYYGYPVWGVGLDGYMSTYDDFDTPVYQLSPFITAYMGMYSQASLTAKIHTQQLPDDDATIFNTMELNYKYAWKSFSVTTKMLVGDSKYGVFNDGFVVYNTDDTMRDGYQIGLTYYASNRLSFTIGQEYRRLIASGETDVSSVSKSTVMATLSL